MSKAIIDKYTRDELEQIVKSCNSYRQIVKKVGYISGSGSNVETVKKRIEKYNIDVSHFYTDHSKCGVARNEENIFIENSTASQRTLRQWYKKNEYTPYICSICGLEPFWQGKDLTLILDHINGINNDHRLENLRWVCPNCNQQLETTGFKKMRVRSVTEKEKRYCIDCGIEISASALRCQNCANKQLRVPLEEMPITREELKKLIRTESFTSIGVKFGITDNAIRKWCDKFNLPRKKQDINKYSDEEWENI